MLQNNIYIFLIWLKDKNKKKFYATRYNYNNDNIIVAYYILFCFLIPWYDVHMNRLLGGIQRYKPCHFL